jgi:hypothetical protein
MDILQLDILLDLLKFREITLFHSLVSTLDKKTKVEKKNPFEVLMFEVSDNVQNLAQTYGERQALQFCIQTLSQVKCGITQRVFEVIFKIFAADMIIRDLGFYMTAGVINQTAGKSILSAYNGLIKDLAASSNDVIESLNVPTHALYTPIVGDYVKYNEVPHYGEVINAKL